MKRTYLFLILLLAIGAINAQEENDKYIDKDEFKTVFGKRSVGGYGAIGLGYTTIDDKPGITVDARAAVVLGHSLSLGVGGAAFVNTPEYIEAYSSDINIVGGYGGFIGELILFPRSPVHLSFPVLAGLGASGVATWIDSENVGGIEETAIFMIVEPSAELEFNLTRYFRMCAYFSYRYTSDLDYSKHYVPSAGALNAYSLGMRFKFGKF